LDSRGICCRARGRCEPPSGRGGGACVTQMSHHQRCQCYTNITPPALSVLHKYHTTSVVSVTQMSHHHQRCQCYTNITPPALSVLHKCHTTSAVSVTQMSHHQRCQCYTNVTPPALSVLYKCHTSGYGGGTCHTSAVSVTKKMFHRQCQIGSGDVAKVSHRRC
jgi:hypothetical protein